MRVVGILFNPADNAARVEAAARLASRLGLEIQAVPVARPADLPAGLASVGRHADVLWAIPDAVAMSPESAKTVMLFCLRNRLPLIGLSAAWVRAGALAALDPDYRVVGQQVGALAARALAGAAPAALPPETPRVVRSSVNRRTLELLAIELSPDALAAATLID